MHDLEKDGFLHKARGKVVRSSFSRRPERETAAHHVLERRPSLEDLLNRDRPVLGARRALSPLPCHLEKNAEKKKDIQRSSRVSRGGRRDQTHVSKTSISPAFWQASKTCLDERVGSASTLESRVGEINTHSLPESPSTGLEGFSDSELDEIGDENGLKGKGRTRMSLRGENDWTRDSKRLTLISANSAVLQTT